MKLILFLLRASWRIVLLAALVGGSQRRRQRGADGADPPHADATRRLVVAR